LDAIDWVVLSFNNFSQHLSNIETKQKMTKVFFEVDSFVGTVPSNSFSCLPNGGCEYLGILGKYT